MLIEPSERPPRDDRPDSAAESYAVICTSALSYSKYSSLSHESVFLHDGFQKVGVDLVVTVG